MMLTLFTDQSGRDCQGLSRREFIQAGALGLGGLTLPGLLAARAEAAKLGGYVYDKSVVLLFLGGGASHIETFNPNMNAPAPYHSVTGEVKTSLPGVAFGGTFPQLANLAHRMAIVRSFSHSIGEHARAISHVLSGGSDPSGGGQDGYSMGSMCARLRGATHPRTGLPSYALVTAPEVDGQYRTEKGRIQAGSRPGALGPVFAPFDPSDGGESMKNMQLSVPAARLDDRRRLLKALDKINRRIDASGALGGFDKFEQQAIDLIMGGASRAFDLSQEDPRLVERYDTSSFRVGKKVFRPSTLGKQMLMARRLCEAGCGFVTVQSAGWDMHADGNNPGIAPGMEMLGRPLDKALSAFLKDIEQRGLSEKILLVITGDFGRTPKINPRGGRDHWAQLSTLALAGGGLRMGQVIGQSGRHNDVPSSEPIFTSHLMATIMHALFDISQMRLDASAPRELAAMMDGTPPISQLF